MYTIYDNFLTRDEMIFTENYFKRPIWEFGHTSTDSNSPQKWFIATLDHLPFFTELLKEKIEQLINLKCSIERVYANGQTILNDGSWHEDCSDHGYITALLYVSDIKRQNVEQIKGHTEFKINGNIISLEPIKNRLVVFDSNIVHRGLAPNVPGFLRISVAWKLKKLS